MYDDDAFLDQKKNLYISIWERTITVYGTHSTTYGNLQKTQKSGRGKRKSHLSLWKKICLNHILSVLQMQLKSSFLCRPSSVPLSPPSSSATASSRSLGSSNGQRSWKHLHLLRFLSGFLLLLLLVRLLLNPRNLLLLFLLLLLLFLLGHIRLFFFDSLA